MKHLIRVSRENIADGVPGDVCKCAAALALEPVCPRGSSVFVLGDSFEFVNNFGFERFDLGKRVQKFIADFDARKPVEPIEFWIDI